MRRVSAREGIELVHAAHHVGYRREGNRSANKSGVVDHQFTSQFVRQHLRQNLRPHSCALRVIDAATQIIGGFPRAGGEACWVEDGVRCRLAKPNGATPPCLAHRDCELGPTISSPPRPNDGFGPTRDPVTICRKTNESEQGERCNEKTRTFGRGEEPRPPSHRATPTSHPRQSPNRSGGSRRRRLCARDHLQMASRRKRQRRPHRVHRPSLSPFPRGVSAHRAPI